MTYKEKAKIALSEIDDNCYIHIDKNTEDSYIDGFIDGSKYRDQQFKEFLEKKKEANPLIYRSDWRSYENDIYHTVINEIINDFFKND